METVIQLLIFLLVFDFLLKISFWKIWQMVVISVICGVFVFAVYPYAIEQSKTQITDFLNNPKMLLDASVLITIESGLGLAFCFSMMKSLFGEPWKYQPLLTFFPGILIFPVLFYLLTSLIFMLPGIDFAVTAGLFAVILVIGIPSAAFGLKRLLPEKDLRLELLFLCSFMTVIVGLISTANGKTVYSPVGEDFNFKSLLFSISILFIGVLLGYFWYKIKSKIKNRKTKFI
jgi:predicted neutral ceramidase superfamily lipid hydrolase